MVRQVAIGRGPERRRVAPLCGALEAAHAARERERRDEDAGGAAAHSRRRDAPRETRLAGEHHGSGKPREGAEAPAIRAPIATSWETGNRKPRKIAAPRESGPGAVGARARARVGSRAPASSVPRRRGARPASARAVGPLAMQAYW